MGSLIGGWAVDNCSWMMAKNIAMFEFACIAANQCPACEALASANIIEYLGHKDHISGQAVLAAIEKLVSETALRNTLAEDSAALVDGRGIQRVMGALA